eukprot:CAMPEP_0171335256 /NCGR_PEP_ID=MMETSP0878-20121228/5217_1 /TAXON_ID=67004 /ORGANISM="Thalassiosira weissflogii, Strain CCMP1336" /LENGTH=99 /DNA_ID=CAMNT_0011836491 /DNA_START=54 /DNA_END=354 /DNA_ORIENTATION=-
MANSRYNINNNNNNNNLNHNYNTNNNNKYNTNNTNRNNNYLIQPVAAATVGELIQSDQLPTSRSNHHSTNHVSQSSNNDASRRHKTKDDPDGWNGNCKG